MKQIVIVGGGAGGLELATRLGDSLGRKRLAEITLIDANRTHLWKPLLHEVASGSLDTGHEALSYRAHSSEHHYYFAWADGCSRQSQSNLDSGAVTGPPRQRDFRRTPRALRLSGDGHRRPQQRLRSQLGTRALPHVGFSPGSGGFSSHLSESFHAIFGSRKPACLDQSS